MGKEIISRSEYSFDFYHQVRDSSNSNNFSVNTLICYLFFVFHIHTHFDETSQVMIFRKKKLT